MSLDNFLETFPSKLGEYEDLLDVPVANEEEPYRERLVARQYLEDFLRDVDHHLFVAENKPVSADDDLKDAMKMINDLNVQDLYLGKASIHRLLGMNYCSCEETPSGVKHLEEALFLYYASPKRSTVVEYVIACLNQLGQIQSGYMQGELAFNYFNRAKILYHRLPPEQQNTAIENQYTLTIFGMAQAYAQLGKPGLSAHACAETLDRQLVANLMGSRQGGDNSFVPSVWWTNCMELGTYFCQHLMFTSATYIMTVSLLCAELASAGTLMATLSLSAHLPPLDTPIIEPEFEGNSREQLAEIHRQLGVLYLRRFEFGVQVQLDGLAAAEASAFQDRPADLEIYQGDYVLPACVLEFKDKYSQRIQFDQQFPEHVVLEKEEKARSLLAEEGESGESEKLLKLGVHTLRPAVHFPLFHSLAKARINQVEKDFLPTTAASVGTPLAFPYGASVFSGDGSAIQAFRLALHYLQLALDMFVYDEYATTHAEIRLYMVQLYDELIKIEGSASKIQVFLKRQIDLLKPLLTLNPKVFTHLAREVLSKLADVYENLRLFLISQKQKGASHWETLANEEKEVRTQYLQTFGKPTDPNDPIVEADSVLSYLSHILALSRLHKTRYSPWPSTDGQRQAEVETIQEYRRIMTFYEKNDDLVDSTEGCGELIKMTKELLELSLRTGAIRKLG